MPDESANEPIPLSDVLLTLQRELHRVQQEALLDADGGSYALIREDVSFKMHFHFTPVAAQGEGNDASVDAILVDELGVHEMTLEGKISPDVKIGDKENGQ